MTTDIQVPSLGESVTEATIARWYKKIGDPVTVDEPLLELETDKVTLEVPAPATGQLTDIKVNDGDTVEVGAILGSIVEGQALVETKPEILPDPEPIEINEEIQEQADTIVPEPVKQVVQEIKTAPTEASNDLSPAVRKIVAENNINPDQIMPSGKNGRITKEDALNFLANKSEAFETFETQETTTVTQPKTKSNNQLTERVSMSRLRKTIAKRLKDAQNTAAILTTFNEVDMSELITVRTEYKEFFEKKHGVKLGFMSFFVKACITALKEIPEVNAEIENDDVIYKNYYNMGVAVGTNQGLVVPVVKNADELTVADIEKEISSLGKKARDGKLSISDMQDGTFTISNGGVYGSLMSTPIINPPQSGVLGMHKIQERPIAINGEIKIRPMMYLALSYDHRLIDGKAAVTFLVRVKESLEDPRRILLSV
ncbi:2-oxoglutarate dehydrogenase complex dihydrolipoyllysine-residue succinyltransferase [Pelagibacteraceae bacterium]|nr:2-oxoglutarate dehydrogenase complex dihydrolipoyllysine-residue succinyltransferase [Pelagibacteraceae bacterium]